MISFNIVLTISYLLIVKNYSYGFIFQALILLCRHCFNTDNSDNYSLSFTNNMQYIDNYTLIGVATHISIIFLKSMGQITSMLFIISKLSI